MFGKVAVEQQFKYIPECVTYLSVKYLILRAGDNFYF